MSNTTNQSEKDLSLMQLHHKRDRFLTTLASELAGVLQDVVGLDEAEGFVSIVGQRLGSELNTQYKRALAVTKIPQNQLGSVMVDLKARINGDFFVIEQDDTKIVLGNRHCPFGSLVHDRPSLCMMTSNVFGSIAADNAGYSKVALEKTIAQGDSGCRVVIYLDQTAESQLADGREYFRPGG